MKLNLGVDSAKNQVVGYTDQPLIIKNYTLFFKLEYLNQNFFYPTLKKHNFFSCEHRVYLLKGFKSYIEKIIFFLVNIEYIS